MMEVARPCSITIQQPSCVVCVTDDDFADENVLETFSLSRSHALQRSQDSGAVTDWSRGSPTRHSCKSQDSLLSDGSREDPTKFVTVLSVNGGLGDRPSSPSPEAKLSRTNPDFVTVLAIGETAEGSVIYPTSTGSISLRIGSPPPTENERTGAKSPDHTDEVVTLIRRPGEKLGFGLKFDGGSEKNQRVRRLFIQCCAPGSAASSVHCTWGKLGEADEILDICGEPVTRLTRAQVVHQLTEGSTALLLIIRHLWNEQRRNEVRAKYLRSASAKEKSRLPKKRCEPQERAVDVPVEFLYSQMSGGLRDSWQLNRHLAACEELAPPVPPRRKRRSKKMTETTASSASPIKSSDDSPLFRSLPGTGRVVCNGIRVNSTAPNKPPRLRLQQSRSLGDERAAANDSRPTPASAEVAFLNCLLPPAGFITDDQRQQKGPGDTVVIDLHEDEVNGDDATARHSQTSLLMAEPPEAEVYINLIAEEDRRLSSLLDLESESDTNSSVSTIIDCWSIAPSSPSYTSLNRSKTFQDSAVESLESLHSLRMQRFNSADLLRGLVRESAPMALMNQRYSQAADSDAEHDSGVGTTDETEPSSLGDDVIDPPETFLDHPQPARDAEDVTEIVETVVGLQVGQIPAPDGSTLSSLPEEPAAECCDMVTDCATERSPKELNESCSDAETPSREGEEQDATTDGVASIPVRREGPAAEFRVEPTPTAVSVAERSSAQSGAEGSSPPARKLPTAVQSESTATGTSSAPNNKININSNINSSRSSKSSSINGDSKLTQSTIDESAGPNKSKARRSRIPQVAVVPFKAGSVSRSAVAVINKKTPSRAASTSRIPLTGVAATRAAPVSTVGRSNSSVAVNKIGTSVLTRPVNGARTTSVATPSRSAYCDVDNKAKEKEKPKRNVKSGLAAPTPATGSVHAASSRIPRPCPPKKAYSPLANKTHSPGVVAANVKATPSSRPVDSTPVKTVKKKPVGSSQLPQQANHHQGESSIPVDPPATCDEANRTKESTRSSSSPH